MNLPHCCATLALVKAHVNDRKNIIRRRAMEALENVCFAAQPCPQNLSALLKLVGQQGVVSLPSGNNLAWAASETPQIPQSCEITCSALLQRHALLGRTLLSLESCRLAVLTVPMLSSCNCALLPSCNCALRRTCLAVESGLS